MVCDCNEVTKEEIEDVIDKGADNYYDVCRITTAGRRCGSCAPLIVDILTSRASGGIR